MPVWNEFWRVKNVPSTAALHITVLDKEKLIGQFQTSLSPGPKEGEIEGPMFHLNNRGTFWLKVSLQREHTALDHDAVSDREHAFRASRERTSVSL